MSRQHGLEWVEDFPDLEPRWTVEPSLSVIEAIARQHLQWQQAAQCTVTFHVEGAFNKLYKVDAEDGRQALMRVALPVDPHFKTASEVATINFIRQKTHISVPEIIAFDASNSNELGFEWILMELMPGKPLCEVWRGLFMQKKEGLIREIASFSRRAIRRDIPVYWKSVSQAG
jgi:hypothetical protein